MRGPKIIDVTDDDEWRSGWCRICGHKGRFYWCNRGRDEKFSCSKCRLYYSRTHDFINGPTVEINRYGFIVLNRIYYGLPGIDSNEALIDVFQSQAITETKIIYSQMNEFWGFWEVLNTNQTCMTTIKALSDWLQDHYLTLSQTGLMTTASCMEQDNETYSNIGESLPEMFDRIKRRKIS